MGLFYSDYYRRKVLEENLISHKGFVKENLLVKPVSFIIYNFRR